MWRTPGRTSSIITNFTISKFFNSWTSRKQSQVINELKLLKLKDAFNDDNELNFYLGNAHIQSETDEELWNEIHRKLLRVPEDLAISWQHKALEFAQEIGAIADDDNLEQLPFVRDEII